MSNDKKTVMISSTSLDLPEHRQQSITACRRQSVTPLVMEDLPARDADAIRVSLEMVDKADAYIGIYAWRYGHIPEGHDISITEMEFNRAAERGIPILVFLIHKAHPITIEMVTREGDEAKKLEDLKARACKNRVRVEFKSPEDLRGLIVDALGALPKEETGVKPQPIIFHPHNVIPAAPAPYTAHPYSLLQTREVVGRRDELNMLTDWVTTNKQVPRDVRLFNFVAIGGMGKSALTWKWFNDIAPNEMPNLAGRMWWSFYESDAYFENLVIRALAYTAGMPEADVSEMAAQDREDQLFHVLDQTRILLVLDGLERILLAYSRMDAAHLADDDLDEKTANDIARFYGLPDEVKETYLEKHRLRQCANPRAGRFLRRLAQVHESRVLISTRLYPAELQTNMARPLPGCFPVFIKGLTDDDALALWREFIGGERSGTSDQLLPLFRAFDNYPLLVRALAGEVAEYHPAPGDFDRWWKDHPDFNPAALSLNNVRTHVLEFALRGLGEVQRRVLHTIAALSMPATWETLRALVVGEGKPCREDRVLDEVLTELEDRGLVGWDKRANRYDLHPIVRGVVWSSLGDDTQQSVYWRLHGYFEAVPKIAAWRETHKLEDLTPAIELYKTLIGLRQHDDALAVFRDHLSEALHFKLSASRQRIELLERLFLDGVDQLPHLSRQGDQAYAFNALALSYNLGGQPDRAVALFANHNDIRKKKEDTKGLSIGLSSLSDALRLLGSLRASEAAVQQGLLIERELSDYFGEAYDLWRLGMTLATRGLACESKAALRRSLRVLKTTGSKPAEGVGNSCLAQRSLWLKEYETARQFADRAWVLAFVWAAERDFVRAARRQGAAAVGLDDFDIADERLHHSLSRARLVNLVEEEVPALVALAELRRRQDKPDEARELLDDVWDAAERGPYPLFHADALNVLAQIERDAVNLQQAIEAATQAYRLAWCDGPPFAYHWGLVAAQKHLRELGAPEPEMPPFDESKFEPMPEVEIDPDDEFHAGTDDESR